MTRRFGNVAATGLVALGVLGLGIGLASASPRSEDSATIKVVMQKLHKGAKAPLATLKTDLSADTPDWKAIQDKTKAFATLGQDLGKNDPPKGDMASWKTFADGYAEACKALDDGARKEDLKATQAALKSIATSCMACHKAHKK